MTNLETISLDKPQTANRAEFLRGIKASLPMLIGLVPVTMFLGAQAAQKGISPLEVWLMTGLNFAGGSEFAAVGLWTNPPPIFLIAAITFLINSRHILMGATFARYINHLPKKQIPFVLFLMVDESWAMSLSDIKQREKDGIFPLFSLPYYLGVAAGVYITWAGFSGIGAMISPLIGNVEAYGFWIAFPAVFLVLLKGMWKSFRESRPWFVSLIVAALTYLLIPGAWYVPAGACAGLLAAYLLGGRKEND